MKRSHRVAALPYNYRSGSHRMDSYSGGAAGSAEAYGPPDQAARRPRHGNWRHKEDYGFHRYDRWKERRRDRGDQTDRYESGPPDGYHEQPYRSEDHAESWSPPHRQYLAARRIAPHYSINAGRANDPWHGYDAYCPDDADRN